MSSQPSNLDDDDEFRQAALFWFGVWCMFLGSSFMIVMTAYALGIQTAPMA